MTFPCLSIVIILLLSSPLTSIESLTMNGGVVEMGSRICSKMDIASSKEYPWFDMLISFLLGS